MKRMSNGKQNTSRILSMLVTLLMVALMLAGQTGFLTIAKADGGDYWDYTKVTDQEISDAMHYMWYGEDGYSLDSCLFFLDRTLDHGGYCIWYSDGKQYRANFCIGTVTQGDRTDIIYIRDKNGTHQFMVEDFLKEDMTFICNSTLDDLTYYRLSEDNVHASDALSVITRVKQFYEKLG